MSDTEAAEVGEGESLGRLVGRGLGWSVVGQVVNRLAVFGSGIVLARLLTKEDFGVYAVGLLVVNLLGAINELGVIPALVRRGEDRLGEAASTALTAALINSLFLYGIAFLAAGALARALGTPDAGGVIRVIAFTIVLDGLSAAHQGLLHRYFKQDAQALAETAGMFVYIGVTVGLAVAGYGPWSIAWGRVAGSIVTALLMMWTAPLRFRPGWDLPLAKEMLTFGIPLALSHLVWEAVLNVDYLIVGRALGGAQLGVYLLAFNLSSWPVSTVSMAISRVSFAGFARLTDDRDRLRDAFGKVMALGIAGCVPVVMLLVVLAPEVVHFIYGSKWVDAVTPVRFLLVLGGLRVLIELMFDLVAADGGSRHNLVVRLVWLGALVPALAVGADVDGLRGVGIAHTLVAVTLVAPLLAWALRRSGIRLLDVAVHVHRPVLAGALALAVMLALRTVIHGNLLRLVFVGGAGAAAYVVAVVPANPLFAPAVDKVRARLVGSRTP